MYVLSLYEQSMNTYSLHQSPLRLEFDLDFYNDKILFRRITLSDQKNCIYNVLDVQVSAKSHYTELKKTVGQIQSTILTFNKQLNSVEWDWVLDSNDISNIEKVRSGDVRFDIEVKLIIQTNEKEIVPFCGRDQVHFSEKDWLSFIQHYGYSTKYGLSLSATLLNDESWLHAFDMLKTARDHMQRGITYDALQQCLSAMEAYSDAKERGGPYDKKSWDGFLKDFIPQKKDGLAELFSGVATYLNKIGHHRESKHGEDGTKSSIPIDHFEVELMLAISHLVVTYLERIRKENSQEANKQ